MRLRHVSFTCTRRCAAKIQRHQTLCHSPSFPIAHRLLCLSCFSDITVSVDKLLKQYNMLSEHLTLLKETMPMAAGKEVFVLKQDVVTISEASSWEVRL